MIHLRKSAAQHIKDQIGLRRAENIVKGRKRSEGIDQRADLSLSTFPKPAGTAPCEEGTCKPSALLPRFRFSLAISIHRRRF
jgi:hypothetical protein